ncbi:MAG: acyltransferase [Lachnospiraceae bacterium]|nr:acyltransferase [Lachnospiraceae bacterium]
MEYSAFSGMINDVVSLEVDENSVVSIDETVHFNKKVRITAANGSSIYLRGKSIVESESSLICRDSSKMNICDSRISWRSHLMFICNSELIMEKDSLLQGLSEMFGLQGRIVIGAQTTIARCSEIRCHFSSIEIGKDNMFSQFVKMVAGDGHKIFDSDGNLITHKECIKTGEHVWLGMGACLLSGSDVGSGSIVGAQSLVNKVIPPNAIAAGNPAKVLREGIRWER